MCAYHGEGAVLNYIVHYTEHVFYRNCNECTHIILIVLLYFEKFAVIKNSSIPFSFFFLFLNCTIYFLNYFLKIAQRSNIFM